MWLGVVTSLTLLLLAETHNQKNIGRNGDAEWGWQMRAKGPGSVGQYFVRLPQSEQQVHYVADGGGYHGSLAFSTNGPQHRTASNFALGRRALELDPQISSQTTPGIPNEIQEPSATSDLRTVQNPVELFILQTHYQAPPSQPPLFQLIPDQNIVQYNPIPNLYYNDLPKAEYYNYVQHKPLIPDQNNLLLINNNQNAETIQSYSHNVNTKPNDSIEVVQVFTDSNCSNTEVLNEKGKNHKVFPKLEPIDDLTVHGNFGAKDKNHLYRGTVNFKVESPTGVVRNDRVYYMNSPSVTTTPNSLTLTEEEGISRLVASTQDLISNDDLLKINHSEETSAIYFQNDDLIKPRPRFSVRSQSPYSQLNSAQSHVSVSTKYGNIVNSRTQHIKNEKGYKKLDDHKFKSPIIVSDVKKKLKQKPGNDVISTVVPYIEDGYDLMGIRNSLDGDSNSSDEDLVNITPRPINQNFLTPITVALRLLESNTTDLHDHEISESENIPNTAIPERTIIEIQHSIPIEITHINDVEYHREYMDEGRSFNGLQNYEKALYNHHKSSDSNNRSNNQSPSYNKNPKHKNSNDNEQASNAYSEVHVNANQQQDNRNFHQSHEIVQPIIIGKQVPITKFVDRYTEKQIPYPESIQVVKQIPVDRPDPPPVRYETIVEKPVEVTKYIDKPYPVEILKPYPVEVRVPYPVEHKIYVDRPVHIPYAVEKVVEKNVIHPVPVPTPVAVPVPVEQKVLYPVTVEKPVERIVHKEVPVPYPVEKKVPYPVRHEVRVPVPYPVERRIPVAVEKPVTRIVEKHIKVPVPHPVERIIEKKVPYPVHIDRIVEKKVPVHVPYPVNTVVEKIVEKPIIVTKYVDKPYPVEKRVPYPVDRIVEKKVPYPVEVPYEQKPDTPYQFEKLDPIYYGYGYQNPIQYIPKVSTLQQNQQLHNYMQAQAESQRNYQIQKASEEYLQSVNKQKVPIHSTVWGNQYASSYSYLNTTDRNFPSNYITSEQKYYGPPPTKTFNFTWENSQDYDTRRTERVPKNLRIEYGGFKPPLIPSTEVDLDGNPIKKQTK